MTLKFKIEVEPTNWKYDKLGNSSERTEFRNERWKVTWISSKQEEKYQLLKIARWTELDQHQENLLEIIKCS